MDKNKFAARRGTSNEAVQVVVRCRPMNSKEQANNFKRVVGVYPSRGVIEIVHPRDDGKEKKKSFTFDAVYDALSTQEEVYNETAHPLVSSILDGFNGTIFAYGQTGTGKTYTMEGSKSDPSQKGIIPRSFDQIFNYISRSKNMQYLVRTSYLEIYQEEIRDLLSKDRRKTYELREAAGIGVYVKDLSSFVCKSAKEIEHVMSIGNQNRSIGATNMNDHSSRSHAIFMITIEMSDTDSFKKIIRVGKLNLIDLAGSERQSKSGATGERLKEASKINLSLSALGNVISALVDGKNPHIPYRDSKLTRILQDSLGGNSKTIMVANIGPAGYNYEETLTTLRYANRAKNIKNKPRVNEDPKDALLREYQMEIARLKGLLAERARQRELLLAVPVAKHGGNEDKDDSECGDKDSTDTEEKLRLVQELEEKKQLLAKEKYASERLEVKIRAMESKLLCGGKNIIDHTNEQQRALEQQKQEIAERKKREVEMRQKLEFQEESALEIRDTYTTLQQEVDYKTKKLKKLFSRLQSIKQEIHDVTEEFNADRRDLEAAHNELLKDLKVRYLVIENFIPAEEKSKLLLRIRFDDSDGSWFLIPLIPDNMLTVKRPVSSGGERRPVSDYGRVAIRLGRSYRYQEENFGTFNPVGKLFKHPTFNVTSFSEASGSHSKVSTASRFSPRVQELLSRPQNSQQSATGGDFTVGRFTNIASRTHYSITDLQRCAIDSGMVCSFYLDSSGDFSHDYYNTYTENILLQSSQVQDEILFDSFQLFTAICCIIYLFRIAYILQVVVFAVISLLNS